MERIEHRRAQTRPVFQSFFRRNWPMLVLAVLFLLGIQVGTICLGQTGTGTLQEFSLICSKYIQARREMSFWQMFFSSLGPQMLLFLFVMFLGFSAISQPILLFVPFFDGLGVGFTAAYLYAGANTRDLLFAMLILIPAAVLSGFTLMLSCRSALYLSCCFFVKISGQGSRELLPVIRRYLAQFVFYFVLMMAAALLNSGAFYLEFHVLGIT